MQINSQQPPPLPPLPPSLASKYNLSVKTYQLESDQINKSTNNNNETSNQLNKQMSDMNILTTPVSLTNNKFDGFETANAKNERKIKGASMCSDSESYFNDQPPEIDTNSESMSGGELSGDTFASPAANIVDSVTNLQLGQFDAAINPSSLASSLLIQSSVSKGNNLSNNINESLNSSLFSGNTTETGTGSISGLSNNGLLLIDSRNNDERSASFIDSKCKILSLIFHFVFFSLSHFKFFKVLLNEQSSKISSLSTNTIIANGIKNTLNSGIDKARLSSLCRV